MPVNQTRLYPDFNDVVEDVKSLVKELPVAMVRV
jgi:hypothetical protein